MSLFIFEGDKVRVTKEIKAIDVFKKISEKENSDELFSFIYHIADWSSPYADLDEEEREERVKEEILEGEEPSELLLNAVERYRELTKTPSLRLLESARKGARSLRDYFEHIDPALADNPGREAKDLMNNLTKVGDLLNKFDEWEEIITKEKDKKKTRKGVQINKYNK